ncbi:tetratricopeptide repeat protein [Polaromonas sp.]|uniref:tetratricopeptide repeat protein n=1 Tax=Polaromonas sp. TaxID=1869339 RepID=UPI002FC6F52C
MKSINKLIILIFTLLALAASAYAQSPREQLNQMVQQLQQTPTDNALREKIIKLAQDVKPALAVPPEAKRAFVMGGTYQKEAKSSEDFGLAVKAFQDASTAAPWWGDAYYNLSVALESAKRYDEAKNALTLYLLTKPKDAEQAQERLYAIEAKKDLSARAAKPVERAKEPIEGYWFFMWNGSQWQDYPQFAIDRRGDAYELRDPKGWCTAFADVIITAREARFTCFVPGTTAAIQWSLSLQGGDLAGTNFNPRAGVPNAARFVRKDWKP